MTISITDYGTALNSQLPITVGNFIGAFLTGSCATLGTICFVLLSSKTQAGNPKRRLLLQIYLLALTSAVVGYSLIQFIITNIYAIFRPHSFAELGDILDHKLSIPVNLFQALVIWLSDGLLVWRCYKVHKALSEDGPSLWDRVSWAIPAALWAINFVIGLVTCAIRTGKLADPLQATLFICNALTNIYGTFFITIRLLQHRQMARACLGDKVPVARYHRIMSILLESAAINVPIAIFAAVGNLASVDSPLWAIVFSIVFPSQALTTILIIYQVARGRAVSEQSREELTLVMSDRSRDNHENGHKPFKHNTEELVIIR
ncbi:hypothetical protein P691DRAFT_854360 [Macrolepiota fuliginosa MF-IS2]|uniref:Uncharacterized protein n=1 Tax=Macrolepiota fuliginosa MF-IS2 TaxID=1400762 RepID=A0A9P5XE12_9AGAR|nr:hypothetical protein P691DRAFT_854360 [Macrolepiota fuliginosa MF-IS2]